MAATSVTVHWPNGHTSQCLAGSDWLVAARTAGVTIPTGCLGGSCGACEIFAPILRSVADSHGLAVMAVSMDGGPSKDFTNYVVDSGQRERMGVPGNATPALVLFDTATKKTVPIGFGILSADEIMDRIFMLTNTKVGSDY